MSRISTRNLKWLTTILLLLALVLMLFGPWIVRRPRRLTARTYLVRIALYGGGLGVAALGAGICAFMILRREQEFYREKSLENMRLLIEATKEDKLIKDSHLKRLTSKDDKTRAPSNGDAPDVDAGAA